MLMCGLNRCPINNKSKQQTRQCAIQRIRAAQLCGYLSIHVFKRYVRVRINNIGMPRTTVKQPAISLRSHQVPLRECAFASVKSGLATPGCRAFRAASLVWVLVLFSSSAVAQAQALRAQITTTSLAPAKVRIQLELPEPSTSFSFRNSYGDVLGLAQRIADVEATDANSATVKIEKLAPGEFLTGQAINKLTYTVNLTEPARPAQMARVSWLNREHGVLMLGDLLPQLINATPQASPVWVDLQIPSNWNVSSNAKNEGSLRFLTEDPAKSVFLVSASLREGKVQTGATSLSLAMSGKWPFSERDALEISRKIVEEYSRVTGFVLTNNAAVMLIPASGDAGPEFWSAETRGNAVVVLMGKKANRKRVLASLGVVLGHELFHLWVPNSLNLQGDYDWFFEGFTLYQALRTYLRLGMINFDTYLQTIGHVYQSYLAAGALHGVSLIEASKRRWTSAPRFVYDAGMLVAFVYDLKLNSVRNCATSLDDVYRNLFQRKSTGQENANETIIRLLNEPEGMDSITQYVPGGRKIVLEDLISEYGFRLQRQGSKIKFEVDKNASERKRNLLKCIGSRK
jgi:predicted metalloprotease with PDZ domain